MLYGDNQTRLDEIYTELTELIRTERYGFKVWKRDTFPKRFGYVDYNRVGDVIVEPEIGWHVPFLPFKCIKTNPNQVLSRATHGYSPDEWQMRALLIMSGPAFAVNRTIDEIPENIDLYQLMCHVLGIDAAPNNGSMKIVKQALLINNDNQLPIAFPSIMSTSAKT
jgi:predicted AlkP superfamily pyrophosphatase or phosphodiesterase